MKKMVVNGVVSNTETLNLEKRKKIDEYNKIVKSYNVACDKRVKLKREADALEKELDIIVEDKIEKLTGVWALLTAFFSYDFLTFWGGEWLYSFLITMFCSVPISTIALYLIEIVFYDKFVQFFSMIDQNLKRLYSIYDDLNDDISKVNEDIKNIKISKRVLYRELINQEKTANKEKHQSTVLKSSELSKNNSGSLNLNPIDSNKTVIVEGFTFKKRVKKR